MIDAKSRDSHDPLELIRPSSESGYVLPNGLRAAEIVGAGTQLTTAQ
ncbi:MAG TPA: hypothetical protein VIP11_01550 [Gemmatimonadaceae bacterium]